VSSIPKPFRLFALHPKALLVEWETKPSFILSKKLVAIKKSLEGDSQVSRIALGYHSILIHLNKKFENKVFWSKRIQQIQAETEEIEFTKGLHWKIPVCYEKEYAPDLLAASQALGIDSKNLIEIHSQKSYHVNFIGFLPGFLYLSGLDERLQLSRKKKPNLFVPSGSVGIGGSQTGIYPQDSPGGWHVIGKTPIALFDPRNNPPCFASAGDMISFIPIDSKSFLKIKEQIQNGHFKLNPHD